MNITNKGEIAQKLKSFKPSIHGAFRVFGLDNKGTGSQEWVERGTVFGCNATVYYIFTHEELLKCVDSTDIHNFMDLDHITKMEIEESGEIKERLEYLRQEIEHERISYGEIAELEFLAEHIDPSDVLLLQWAGVAENGELLSKLEGVWFQDGDMVMTKVGSIADCASGRVAQMCAAAPDLLEACRTAAWVIRSGATGRDLAAAGEKLEAAILKASGEPLFVETSL